MNLLQRLLRPFARLRRFKKTHDVPRRTFLALGIGGVASGAALLGRAFTQRPQGPSGRVFIPEGTLPIRPPGALANDNAFLAACVSCGLCGDVCEAGCIRFFGIDEAEHGPMTPFIDTRRRSCTLCMKCNDVCPSGALLPIVAEPQAIKENVRMGTAVVDPELCISYLGRVCGYCHDACPLPNHAIKLIPPATPKVEVDGCVGCGRCAEYCPQTPTAISVVRMAEENV